MGKQKGKRPGVMVYFDLRPSLKRFTLEEKGILFDAILAYAEDGEIPVLNGSLEVAWDFIQPRIDADAERYASISHARSEASRKSHATGDTKGTSAANAAFAANSTSTQIKPNQLNSAQHIKEADKPPRAPRFSPPSVEDVRAYIHEKGLSLVDADTFVDFYTSKSWKVGSATMKDWRAVVRNWNRREEKEQAAKTVTTADRIYTAADYLEGW